MLRSIPAALLVCHLGSHLVACVDDARPVVIVPPPVDDREPPLVQGPGDDDDEDVGDDDDGGDDGGSSDAVVLAQCGPSLIDNCLSFEDDTAEVPVTMPAILPPPAGPLPAACRADVFFAEQRGACGDVVDVAAPAGTTLADALALCPVDGLCRLQLPPGEIAVDVQRTLYCVYLRGDDDGSTVLAGGVGAERAGLEQLRIRSRNDGASVTAHALFLDVDIVADSSGLRVGIGDVRVCRSTIRGAYEGMNVGGHRERTSGLLVDHSVVAGCHKGIGIDGAENAIADSIVQGSYEAVSADDDAVQLRRSRLLSNTYGVDTIDVGPGSCSDGVCGVDYGSCGAQTIDFALPPVDPSGGLELPLHDDVPVSIRCEPGMVATLANIVTLQEVDDAGLQVPLGADARGQDYAWCVDTVRFVDNFAVRWWYDDGVERTEASAFPVPCESETGHCGTLHFAGGPYLPNTCSLIGGCQSFVGGARVMLRAGVPVRADPIR